MADTILHPHAAFGDASRSGRWFAGLALPESPIEHAAFWAIVGQFLFFFAGLAPVAPLLATAPLLVLTGAKIFRERIVPHWLALLWFGCMAGVLMEMLVVFWLKGVGGWYVPGWLSTFGLAAFIPMAGAFVRPTVVFSAATILGVQALIYSVLAWSVVSAGLDPEYHSPIPTTRLVDPAFHVVRLIQPKNVAGSESRLLAFTPFPTSAGATACVFALLTLGQSRKRWKMVALSGWVILVVLTFARTAMITGTIGAILYGLLRLPRRYIFLGSGVGLLIFASLTGPLIRTADTAYNALRGQRPSSSQDRANLRTLAWEGWLYGEDQVLGAGASVRGGPIVRDVGIGTHDTLGSNLFIRGALGFGLTMLPVAVTLVFGFFAGRSPAERLVTAIAVVLLGYTYSQELQTLYVHIWPIFLLIGAIGPRSAAPVPLAI